VLAVVVAALALALALLWQTIRFKNRMRPSSRMDLTNRLWKVSIESHWTTMLIVQFASMLWSQVHPSRIAELLVELIFIVNVSNAGCRVKERRVLPHVPIVVNLGNRKRNLISTILTLILGRYKGKTKREAKATKRRVPYITNEHDWADSNLDIPKKIFS
jgi:hypothetical protein